MTEETTTPMPPAPAVPAPTLVQKLAAESIGTLILVVFGCGAATAAWIANQREVNASFVGTVGLAFGLAIVVTVYAFGRISGGHFNPAVSVGAAISGRISWIEAAYYAGAQIVGAIVGAFLVWITAHGFKGYDSTDFFIGENSFGDGGIRWWGALIAELVLTAIFVLIILATTDTRNEHPGLAPLAIGLTLAAIHFVAIPLTGTSVNPARSIGPALFAGGDALKDLWLFIIAPLLGAILAGVVYPLLWGRAEEPVPGSGWQFATAKPAVAPGWGAPDQLQQQWNQQDPWAQAAGPQAPASPQYAQQPAAPAAQDWGQPAAQTPQQELPNEQTQISGQSWQQPAQPAAEGELPVYEQDGWRWDYAKQQWVPIEDNGQTPQA
ncbi:MIP/aquaporin family protein [Nocardioides sp. DS6]|uniref:MIP/aquaporin family protein n=1 Tax=Nocardioides eburneus TaxID=3231482 RepID=A0ABV3SYY4_9ACTN